MSPEQASGGTIDERTDLYALGIVMYEMFTGRVPFEADTYMGVLTKHLYVEPTPPSVLLGEPSELGALEQVILRCLEKKPEKRFASMAALSAELKRVASFSDLGEVMIQPVEPAEPRVRHRLADDLELPTASELEHALSRAGPRRFPTWVAALLAGFAVTLTLLVVLTRTASRRPVPGPESSVTVSLPAPEGTLNANPSAPSVSSGDREEVPVVPSASAPASEAHDVSARARRMRPKPGAGGSSPPAPVPRNPSTAKPKMVGGDIIDPWSR